MAKVLGESGRYVSDEAMRKRKRMLLCIFIIVGLCGGIEGFLLSLYFHPAGFSKWLKEMLIIGVAVGVWALWRGGNRKLETLDREQTNYQRGADGENMVGRILATFPDNFSVINDLKTPFGNLDHVVVGPTGVFVLDTKNWRGVVSGDGKGELMQNGKPTTKPEIRQFTGRMMGIRDKVKLLAPGLDPFYNGVFVFTSARVEANWGKTGKVNCITDDQLHNYIIEKDFGKRMNKDEVNQIARAFLGLAQMDAGFAELPLPRSPSSQSLSPA